MSLAYLPELAKQRLEQRKTRKTEFKTAPALSFIDFINQASNGHYRWYDYLAQSAAILQRVSDDELKRVMIFMPPRHGKSEQVSRLFSAYYLYRHPQRWVGLNSYGASLSYTFSRNARDNFRKIGGVLKDDAGAISQWETLSGGGVWASGAGGAITGRGFHLGIIDDPVKNAEEANSLTIQTRNNDWFDSTFWTRQEPGAAIVLIQTRWSRRDLAGYILSKEEEEPEAWHIIHLEAIKTGTEPKYHETCTLESDPRQIGEALNPDRYPIEKLRKIKGRIGTYFFGALYQQSPTQKSGLVYHAFGDSCIVSPGSVNLDLCSFYHAHDFGAVNQAFGLFAKDPDGVFYLCHEAILPEGTTKARAALVKSHFRNRKVVAGYGGAASEKQQRADWGAEGVSIREPRITDVEGGVDAVNKMLETGKLKILNTMTLTIDQLENCVRDEKEQIADKSQWHHLDVLRYFAAGVNKQGFRGSWV